MSIKKIAMIVVYGLLAGCIHHTTTATVTVNKLAQCQLLCKQKAQVCDYSCYNNACRCNQVVQVRATRAYCAYKKEQLVKGGLIVRDKQSYRDQLKCRKITCNCFADLNVCMQSCKGNLYKELRAPGCQ